MSPLSGSPEDYFSTITDIFTVQLFKYISCIIIAYYSHIITITYYLHIFIVYVLHIMFE